MKPALCRIVCSAGDEPPAGERGGAPGHQAGKHHATVWGRRALRVQADRLRSGPRAE